MNMSINRINLTYLVCLTLCNFSDLDYLLAGKTQDFFDNSHNLETKKLQFNSMKFFYLWVRLEFFASESARKALGSIRIGCFLGDMLLCVKWLS